MRILPFLAVLVAIVAYFELNPPAFLKDSRLPLFHPEWSHLSENEESPVFFEGWYFKLVSGDGKDVISLIPGIIKTTATPAASHAFVMAVINGQHQDYYRFSSQDFQSPSAPFGIRVNSNSFSENGLAVSLDPKRSLAGSAASSTIKGTVTFNNPTPWPITLLSPGVMGPFAFLSLECFHGILSLHHRLSGSLTVTSLSGSSSTIDFDGGSGYIEKDWGTNFPKSWIWFQTNSCHGNKDASIFLSVADVPVAGFSLEGLIAGVMTSEGSLYRFASYLASWVESVHVDDDHVELSIRNLFYRLRLSIRRPAHVALLHAPRDGKMMPFVKEGLHASAHVVLTSALPGMGGHVIFEDTCSNAGLEVMGSYDNHPQRSPEAKES